MKIINGEKYYTISEVSQLIGVTRVTILRWYEYEKNKDSKYNCILPSYIRMGGNNTMYFNEKDIYKFKEFKDNTKKGDMAQISGKYNGSKNNPNKTQI